MATLTDSRISGSEETGLAKPMKRCNKPLMEKRRRERINASLNQLKSLVLDALKKDTSQYSKLEKADILEMTVRHLRNTQRHQLSFAASTDASVVSKYRAGFAECASEVTRYLSSVEGLDSDVHARLLHHLSGITSQGGSSVAPMQQQQHVRPLPTNTAYTLLTSPVQQQQQTIATMSSSLPGTTIPIMVAAPHNAHAQMNNAQPKPFFGAFQVIPASVLSSNGSAQPLVIPISSPTHLQYAHFGTPTSPIPSNTSTSSSSSSSSPPVSPASSYASSRASSISPPTIKHSTTPRHACLPHHTSMVAHVQGARDSLNDERVWRPW